MLDLMAEYRKRLRRINQEAGLEPVVKVIPAAPGLYNIHKRSLPIGVDKVVGIGFTREQASQALLGLFKAKTEGTKVTYYDIVAQDATPAEKSVFFNKRPVIVEN